MKRLLLLSVSALLIVGLTACGQTDSPSPTTAPQNETVTTTSFVADPTQAPTTTWPSASLISKEEAKSAAFARAGVKAAAATRLQVELDFDDDRRLWEYEIEFHVDHVEYSVDVNAETGEVLSFEKDYD